MSIRATAEAAKASLPYLARSAAGARNLFLERFARNVREGAESLLSANSEDVSLAREAGHPAAFLDRLALTAGRAESLAASLLEVAALPDPLFALEDMERRATGLMVARMRIPLGVIAFICEARPGAAAEAAALAVKSGNAMIVKPGKESARSSKALGDLMKKSLSEAGLPEDAVSVLPSMDREDIRELVSLDGLVDLVIPRGGEGLIRFVAENSRVPVLKHYKGVCHLYVDEGADLEMALKVTVDAKTSRPGTCNALECLLVHAKEAKAFLPRLALALRDKGVSARASAPCLPHLEALGPALSEAVPEDFGREYLDLVLNIAAVPDLDGALAHIRRYGSCHTDGIITRDLGRAGRFLAETDSSCVMVNASTRLNDGGVLGLGSEIGISTSKLHAYGPMGLKELTARKFVVLGEGHVRG
ncbi:MAG: glutamate-5-semialdehyde dehydrogenase [Deltaproteobacteria bacterium]|jgi:glutamate-5-semialdehyde dehydrogenase|nr:glutamate-5-semialdehyde dehydrogenase [Deltaproteobacteria bacterium]